MLGPGGGDPPAREQARVQLVPEAREVEVPDAERAVDPHALAERAAHDAIEERQILGEDDVPASMADWLGRYSRRKWWKDARPRMPPLTNSTRVTGVITV